MNKTKQREVLILILCVLIGLVLRLHTFDRRSLWVDEIYTFNDSRDGLKDQLEYYRENPTYPHPPLFFVLTHFFYPFEKPERDLRMIPLIFGILSLLMIYFVSRSFSHDIALPCTLSLTFMTYHISLSQDARPYSLLLFLSMSGLYFFMKYLKTSKRKHLILVAFFYSALFHTSYSTIPFILLSQVLWLYNPRETDRKPVLASFITLNGLILLFCLPWTFFIVYHFEGQSLGEYLRYAKENIPLWSTAYWIFHDWASHALLMLLSILALILFAFLSKNRTNAIVLLSMVLLPIGGVYLFCSLLNLSHFITSRYFISFLPIFFVSIYLAIHTIENRLKLFGGVCWLSILFLAIFTAANLNLLRLYYGSEKQDFRGVANYLKKEIQDGDSIIVLSVEYFPGILHYLGVYPNGRHYRIPCRTVSENELEYRLPLVIENRDFVISCSKKYWLQYALEGSRLWFVLNKTAAEKEKGNPSCILKGRFDGSFLNLNRFPTDASMYLFLWGPESQERRGIDVSVQ